MQPQQFPGHRFGLAEALGQRLRPHAVLDGQGTDLELLPLPRVAFLRRVGRHGPRLLGERQVRVAGRVGVHHGRVARQRRGNAKFLLRPIDVGHGPPRLGLESGPATKPKVQKINLTLLH